MARKTKQSVRRKLAKLYVRFARLLESFPGDGPFGGVWEEVQHREIVSDVKKRVDEAHHRGIRRVTACLNDLPERFDIDASGKSEALASALAACREEDPNGVFLVRSDTNDRSPIEEDDDEYVYVIFLSKKLGSLYREILVARYACGIYND